MQRSNLSQLFYVSHTGCSKSEITDAGFGPLIGSGLTMPDVDPFKIINKQPSWVWARTIKQRTTPFDPVGFQPSLMNDGYGAMTVGVRFEGVYSRLRIDCVEFAYDVGTPWAATPYPANTSDALEVLGPVVQYRIRLGLNLAGFDRAVDLDWQPPVFAKRQTVSDYGSLVNISGIPFDSVLIYTRFPQNQQGFTQSQLLATAGFQVYADLQGSTSRVLASCGEYATITGMQRSFERNTNLP